jgi:pimeloyl-ACP methyl ester carboxylesterase
MNEAALVLLPGLDGSGVLFRPLLGHLPSTLRPIVLSYPPDQMLGYDELLPIVLAALPTTSPFVLLGESFAGPLALKVAATRPHGLGAVILCATFIRNPVWFRPAWLRYFSRPVAFRFFPVAQRCKALLAGYSTSELRALSSEALSQVRPEVLAHRVRTVLEVDVRQELADCPVPILYLRGDRDYVVPRHNMSEIAAARPSVQIARLPAPHMVLQTQPAAAGAAIATFIEGLAPSA